MILDLDKYGVRVYLRKRTIGGPLRVWQLVSGFRKGGS
jgi:hypothetical protein